MHPVVETFSCDEQKLVDLQQQGTLKQVQRKHACCVEQKKKVTGNTHARTLL
jgi:hypothetical protein